MNVLVTRTAAYAANALIRLLNRISSLDLNIYGCDTKPYEMNSANKWVYKFFETPGLEEPQKYILSINKICDTNNIDLVIPVMDDEIRIYNKYRHKLHFNIVLPPEEVINLFHDKLNASIEINKIGISTPAILSNLIGKSKVIFRNRVGIGSNGIYIVDLRKAEYIKNHFNKDVFIQEYIDGEEYTVDILSDKSGHPCMIIPRKRLTIVNGVSYRCQIIENYHLIEACKLIYSKFQIPGLSNVQFIIRDNIPYFIELNTRFAATGSAGILGSYNYISTYLKHFVLNEAMNSYNDNMSCIAWNSIISRFYDETISYLK